MFLKRLGILKLLKLYKIHASSNALLFLYQAALLDLILNHEI
jgi:hypothetical protein